MGAWYEIVCGENGNKYDNDGDFLSLGKALARAKKIKFPYVRVDKFEGDAAHKDGDYVATVYEKGASIPKTVRV